MKFYKAKDKVEYDGIMTILSSMGLVLDNDDLMWDSEYPLINFSEGKLDEYDEMIEDDELIPLSEFIALVEKYKSQIRINDEPVVFNKGMIEVGDIAISNELVREIAKNLVD